MSPSIDAFFSKTSRWLEAFYQLRRIILDTELEEELKWGKPCYTLRGNNVALIHGFKKYCAVLFHKGVLLEDEHGLLIQQTDNVQAARQLRFTSAEQVVEMEPMIKDYILDAIRIEKSGAQVELKKTSEFNMSDEFRQTLDETPTLKAAFEALTPGRQRGYLLYFSQPKQSKTREARIEKYMQHILDGKGLND
ncbi:MULTISPECIES: YdeI family protein [unclassified Imperialibacter]|uniref:YdeI/OmpD-associated family protein n=1 Tax=unclassified Imperialibacter TaxID=2629706 RepID=UPI00125EDDD7|nr:MULTISPECIES: YdeI family protein [unclassified Imperialibacter]